MKRTILFDLDGTLVNTGEGITKSVAYALESYGIQETDAKKLERFIGPPLVDSFRREYGFSKEQAAEAKERYRERYEDTGIYECALYPQVAETLQRLKAKGCRIGIASSKPEELCVRLMEHFKLTEYFELIGGARMDGSTGTKAQVLEDVIDRMHITDRKELVLIGDTRYDAEGAKEAGIDCIGITYGFEQDLDAMAAAGTLCICDTLAQVIKYLEKN